MDSWWLFIPTEHAPTQVPPHLFTSLHISPTPEFLLKRRCSARDLSG